MPTIDQPFYSPTVQIPVMAVAELQDSLLIVMNDLQRLEGLISHASTNLLDRFSVASEGLDVSANEAGGEAGLQAVRQALHGAVTELQFQDMAQQLIGHTTKVLKACADRLAAETMGQDDDEGPPIVQSMPSRPNPVTQDEMDAGSIELF
jgi:hypothetical protein